MQLILKQIRHIACNWQKLLHSKLKLIGVLTDPGKDMESKRRQAIDCINDDPDDWLHMALLCHKASAKTMMITNSGLFLNVLGFTDIEYIFNTIILLMVIQKGQADIWRRLCIFQYSYGCAFIKIAWKPGTIFWKDRI